MSKNQGKQARSTQKARSPKTNKKRSQNKNRRGNSTAPRKQSVHLSRCALAFAKARLDPFGFNGNELPCIPDLLDNASMKICTLYRGTFTLGTGGFGFALFAPRVNSSDGVYGCVSQSGYAALQTPTTTGVAGTTACYNSRFPFTTAQARSGRTVAVALRIRYAGTELNRGGSIAGVANNTPGNSIFSAAQTVQDARNRPEAQLFPVTREWKTIVWNPLSPNAYGYEHTSYPLSTSSMVNAMLGFIVEGVAGTTYDLEIVNYEELVSYADFNVTATSKSHSDPVGYGLVRDFLSSEVVQTAGSSAVNRFMSFAANAASTVALSYVGAPTMSVPLIEYL